MSTNTSETARLFHVRTIIVCCLALWLGHTLYETVQRLMDLYIPIPMGDYWRVPQFLKAYQTWQMGVFWKQHNEHRIVFPEIFFAMDVLLGHGRMILPTVVSVLCYALTWGVLCATVARDRTIPIFDRCCGVLVAGVLAFWQGSTLALAQPFLLEWPLMQVGVVLSLLFLKKTADSGRALYLVLTIVMAVVATYSSGNGLLLWVLLLGLAFAVRVEKRFIVALALAAVVFVGLYFAGYQFSGETNVLALFKHPVSFLGFTATYLSMPFGKLISPGFGVGLGLLNLGIVVLSALKLWRAKLLGTLPALILFSFYVFTLLTIAITAAGRMDPADQTFIAATVTRYLSVPMLNWAAVVLLCFWTAARLHARIFHAVTLTLLYSVLLAIGTYKLRSWREANEQPFVDAQVAALHMDVGLSDSTLEARIFPSPEFVDLFAPPLRSQHLAMFMLRHDRWLGLKLSDFGDPMPDKTIAGGITHLAAVEKGTEVVGWVDTADLRNPYPLILLANEKGQVVGWGRRPAAGFPADWRTPETPPHEAWIAYANSAIPSKSISAWAVAGHGKRHPVLPIEGVRALPAIEGAPKADVRGLIPDVTLRVDRTWGQGAIPVPPLWGWQPPATPYNSWQERDDHTGQFVAEFAPPANGCVSAGVLHGPSIGGLSAQFIDADTGTVLANFPLREHDNVWSVWKVYTHVRRVRFVATDNGKEWGQWIAVSGPLFCN